jgi:hypothetical protein
MSRWPLSVTVALDYFDEKERRRNKAQVWREGREVSARDALLTGIEVQNESYHLHVLVHYRLLDDIHKNTV